MVPSHFGSIGVCRKEGKENARVQTEFLGTLEPGGQFLYTAQPDPLQSADFLFPVAMIVLQVPPKACSLSPN